MKIILQEFQMKHEELPGEMMSLDLLDASGIEVRIVLGEKARDYVHQATAKVRTADVAEMNRITRGIAGSRPRGGGKSAA